MKLKLAFLAAAFAALPAFGAISGAVYTTQYVGGSWTVNANVFVNKPDVFLNGGPRNTSSAGLTPNGVEYYFQVTDPSGKFLLSQDDLECRRVTTGTNSNGKGVLTGVVVAGGCEHATASSLTLAPADNGGNPVQLMPFADTTNGGGVYKVWLTPVTEYVACAVQNGSRTDPTEDTVGCTGAFGFVTDKTDNFKVKNSTPPPCDPNIQICTPQSLLTGTKFYDKGSNGSLISNVYTAPLAPNGALDPTEVGISGWNIVVIGTSGGAPVTDSLLTDGNGVWSDNLDNDTSYTVCEVLPNGWWQSAPILGSGVEAIGQGLDSTYGNNCYTGTVSGDANGLNFGNYEKITGTKYYDSDSNGIPNGTELSTPKVVEGVKILFCGSPSGITCTDTGVAFTDANGNYTFYLQSVDQQFKTGEVVPNSSLPGSSWLQTGPLLNADPIPANTGNGVAKGTNTKEWASTTGGSVNGLFFTNVCRVVISNGRTLGFWSNKNGLALLTSDDFVALTAFNLVNANGSARDFTGSLAKNKSDLNSWLLSATATNMAYMLSAQMTATYLATQRTGLNGNTVIDTTPYGIPGTFTINQLIDAANTLLLPPGNVTVSSGALRTLEEKYKNVFDDINNNKTFTFGDPNACNVVY